jgi:hypothetical protein
MRWTKFQLFACAALLCGPLRAATQVERFVESLESASPADSGTKDQLIEDLSQATQSSEVKTAVEQATEQVWTAATRPDSATPSQLKPLVEEFGQTLNAATECKKNCNTSIDALKQQSERLVEAFSVGGDHYVLKRDVYSVWLDTSPTVRIQCNVSNSLGSDSVVFDPQDARGLTRYAILPRSSTGEAVAVSCTSDRLQVAQSGAFFYVLNAPNAPIQKPAGASNQDPAGASKQDPAGASNQDLATSQALVVGCWRGTAEKGRCNSDPAELSLYAEKLERNDATSLRVLRSLTTINPQSTLRSFDPNTLALDLIKVLGTIALERANEGLKHYVRSYLTDQLCNRLTVGQVIERLDGSPLYEPFKLLPKDEYILSSTCTILRTVRIDELASTKDLLWKALMADASRMTFQMLTSLNVDQTPQSLSAVFEAANSVLIRSLLGDQSGTERDVQAMLLSLNHVGSVSSSPLRCGLEAGIAILRLCLRDNTCSADELDLLIQQENGGVSHSSAAGRRSRFRELAQRVIYEHGEYVDENTPKVKATRKEALDALKVGLGIGSTAQCNLAEAVGEWPALRPLLGKIGDVLQPPPGATPAITTANALEIITDIANPFLDEWLAAKLREEVISIETEDRWELVNNWQVLLDRNDYPRTTLAALRKFIAVLRGEDPAMAVAELGRALALAVSKHCGTVEDGTCIVPVKTAQITRAFTVLTAISSYSASYRAAGKDGEVDEAAREEERKKALESVIDAFTDRSHRGGETVFSLGADVGFQFAGMATVDDDNLPNGEGSDYVHNPFSMPMGLALQRLPDPQASGVGCHIMATVIDPAQYATMSSWDSDAKFVRATPATAVRLGLRGGLLLGEPGFPISIVGHVSYSPALELWPEAEEGAEPVTPQSLSVWMYGISAGIYVPFLDFN